MTAKVQRKACELMGLPTETAAQSMVYYYKFCRYHRIQTELSHDQLWFALPAMVLLSCKVCEKLRPIRDIFNTITVTRTGQLDPKLLDDVYTANKHKIIAYEHELIRILNFRFEVDLPYKYMLNVARMCELRQAPVHLALALLNDSFLSEECIDRDPTITAVACLYCGLQLIDEEGTKHWWKKFDAGEASILEYCSWILSIQQHQDNGYIRVFAHEEILLHGRNFPSKQKV